MNEELFTGEITRSYVDANRELVASFVRYMEARGMSAPTIRSYRDSCQRLAETMASRSIVELRRSDIRVFLTGLLKKGLTQSSVRLHTAALRAFYRFIGLSGLTRHDPMLMISHRKLPGRLPRVLTVQEVEALIAAAKDPFERVVPEFLYSTGLRISEAVNLRLENIDFAEHMILVKKGKGGKDRYVLFGSYAARAINEYLAWRPSKTFLFEAPARDGRICFKRKSWIARFYVDRIQREIRIGSLREFPDSEAARREFERIAANIPGFKPVPARPYDPVAIRQLLTKLAHRARVERVHPHALRRAMACHMLSHGADIRAIQELLGHTNLSTTMIYTHLTNQDLKRIHDNCHPRAQGDSINDEKE
jgi:integrase/recombinase XerC